jgi:murein DD-endopeptidase MepM/ murein hydrolase activator NlpD
MSYSIMPAFQHARQRLSGLDRTLIMAIVLVTSVFPVELFPNAPPAPKGIDGQYSGRQGQVVLVKVPVEEAATEVKGTFLDRTIPFFREMRAGEPAGYLGLVGIDLQDSPGTYELSVNVKHGETLKRFSYHLLVTKEKFPVEHLKLPKDKVDLDDKTLARWKTEQEQVRLALADNSALRLWQSGFVEPVTGKRTGIFGSVRVMNGQPRNPHNGEDIGAPLGAAVAATNDGVVRLTVDHVFSGRGVFIDHGLGFYSMYFHLSDVLVRDGDLVKAGQVIGKVGATGRATGPHLHWGVKLNGARVNPYALLDLPFRNGSLPGSSGIAPAPPTVPTPEARPVKE